MADIYIIDSENPKDIVLELQQLDSNNNYIILNSKTAKDLLLEIEEQQNNKRIFKELKQKEQEFENKMRQKPWQDFMYQKTFEPNKLSNKDIENLCLEFYEKFILPNKKRTKIYPKPPKVNIIEELKWLHGSSWRKSFSIGYKNFVTKYLKEIDDEINIKELERKIYRESNFHLSFCDPLNIRSLYSFFINRNNNFGGIVRYGKENYRIFYINFEGHKLSKKSQEFWVASRWCRSAPDPHIPLPGRGNGRPRFSPDPYSGSPAPPPPVRPPRPPGGAARCFPHTWQLSRSAA